MSAGRHAQYCADQDPLVIIKDAGICGTRIIAVRKALGAFGPNRKQHNKTRATCTSTRVFGLSVAASRQ